MKIRKEDLVEINRRFGGQLVRDASLDFALMMQNRPKLGPYKKLAYLWRAILVDHPFSDGNKRSAVFLAVEFVREHQKRVDEEQLVHHAIAIAKKNITDIRTIEWRLKDAIK